MPPLAQRLRRALTVEPGEGRIVGWAAVTLFLIEWASVAVSNASDTLFLKRVGVEYLPIVFLVNSVLLTGTTLAAGRLTLRFDLRRLLTGSFLGLAGLLFVLWVLVVVAAPGIATTLVILSKQIDVIASLMFWTIVSGMMTSRQGKRLVALMTAGGTLGTILGSFTSGPLGKLFGIPALLAVAAVAFVAAALATVPLGRSARPRLYRGIARAVPEQEQQQSLRAFWRDSSLFRVLVCTSFLAGVLGPMLYYEFSCAADLATRTADGEQKLLALYGQLRGWINVGVLAVQIGGSAALFRLIGVPLAATLAPMAYLVGLGGLSLRFGLPTAMPATMGTSVLDHTVYEPAQRILTALLPLRMRTAATSLIQGPAKRSGAALGSLIILAVVAIFEDPSRVALVALPIAALWIALSLSLWRNYPNLLLDAASVRRGESDDDEPHVAFLDAGTLGTLQRSLEGEDQGLCRAACGLFADAPPGIAVEALTRAIAVAPKANRQLLLQTLDRALAETGAIERSSGGANLVPMAERVASSLHHALDRSSELTSLERARLLHILGRALSLRSASAGVRRTLDEACSHESEAVRLAARLACMRAGLQKFSPAELDEALAAAVAAEDPATRATAIAELRLELVRGDHGLDSWSKRLAMLVSPLHAQAPLADADAKEKAEGEETLSERALAVEALADVALSHRDAMTELAPVVLAHVNDRDPGLRSAVLRFVGNAGLSSHAGMLAERLSSRNGVEAAAARRALEVLGPAAVEALLHALRHGGRRGRAVLPAMLRDIRVDHSVLRAVIDREIDRSRELLVVLGVLDASAVSRLLLQRLREQVDESLRVVLELLAAVLDDDRIASVCRSLGPAWNVRDRAVLLEALEALLPAAEGARILPLLEDQSAQRLALIAARALNRPWPTLEEAISRALASHDGLTIALVAATIDRDLLAGVAPWLDVDAAVRVFSASPGHVARAEASGHSELPAESADREEVEMLSQVETMLHLRALDWFEGLPTRQLSELAKVVRELKLPDGSVIVTEGEFDDRMFFIVSGKVRIHKAGKFVAEIGAPDFFGEMAVFDGETRSATAIAAGEVRLLRLARNDLFEVMEEQPVIGIGICQTLVRRVRNMLNERSPVTPES